MKTIALDLGGTRIKIGLIENGILLEGVVLEAFSGQGFKWQIPALEKEIDHLIESHNLSMTELNGIGICLPGITDSNEMKLISINEKFNDAVGFDFKKWIKDKWGLPLIIENDARSALVGEWKYGAGKGCENLILVTLGTGFGGAVVIEGKVLRGKHFQAGCLAGHSTINYKGKVCNCGNIGCVESEASTWRLPEIASTSPIFHESKLSLVELVDYNLVFSLSEEGDALAIEIVNLSLDVWSAGIINQIHAYDPELVVIGGGIMKSGSKILSYITSMVEKHAWTPWGKVKIVQADDLDWAALKGISFLLDEMLNNK
jgi:glucokinase